LYILSCFVGMLPAVTTMTSCFHNGTPLELWEPEHNPAINSLRSSKEDRS
jgi:hypothetical protein